MTLDTIKFVKKFDFEIVKKQDMKYDIFISYRRNGGTYQASALKAQLELKGYKVFMDTHSLKGGNFTTRLKETIKVSANFIVIISKGCFNDKKGGTDYFLYEISQALSLGKNLIPIYYDGITYESIKDFICEIEEFPKQNAINYHSDSPDETVQRIISFLKSEEEILRECFELFAKRMKQARQDILFISDCETEHMCPICQSPYDTTMSYCHVCGYKFFDDLDKIVADKPELIQEKGRIKKHKELWMQSRNCKKSVINNNEEKKELSRRIESLQHKQAKLELEVQQYKSQSFNPKDKLTIADVYVCLISPFCMSSNTIGMSSTPKEAKLDYRLMTETLNKFFNIKINVSELLQHNTLGGIAYSVYGELSKLRIVHMHIMGKIDISKLVKK